MYWWLPKPEPVSTRPLRGHKTYLRLMRREEVRLRLFGGKKRKRKETMVVTKLELF